MSGPRTKRQFAGAASDPSQRSITSFFARTTSSTTSADAAPKPASHTALNGPAIPAQVQTDLLNVGMRVRKAIPEGYKTGSDYSAFTLWAEDNASNASNSRPASTTPSAAFTSTTRELEPFCGLNRVGGLAVQPAYNNSNPVDDDDDGLDSMPGLTSSQDTIVSNASTVSSSHTTLNITTTANRKRIFTSDEDEAARDVLSTTLPYRGPFRLSSDNQAAAAWLEDEISPRSLAPPAGLWENARVMAVPKRSSKQAATRRVPGIAEELMMGGQENVMVVVRGEDGNDFEEASFLDYGGLMGDVRMEM
ncbi:ribonucleotide reductase inhibitor-domain-containing protein [Parachaetomium inaequale]|uniref:Ribonucleotide reductase inhibitor-domain-containing protein n=1 Tax=Parachaetomium inaequale TaxID=2588326 RepID=A0AAN6PNN8_9PEZI|nr:ribonucleotide reductase inhibitor-domain-containing protein [Parachaetomium inaequale]